ncbi:2-polyprenyl-6-methoxyphenol hydroxylase-like FAD-dependent oxidoreductase [Catenulispora sp. EB89]|uniref:FAD-dependent oxidoreductase n=1 Tax=Catenulispora sp. EB89 TaxID=3156257 RepID=UPI003511596A
MSTLKVIVAGAGIGGLALARGLHAAGVEVAVFEKDAGAAFRNQGYRIRVNGDGIRALRNLLAPSAFELFAATAGTPGGRMDTLDQNLRRLHAQTLPDDPELPGGGHLAVNRKTLREILLSGLEDAVSYSARLVNYAASQDGGITAYFADGRTAEGDVLIGADGVNSAVRAQLMPEAEVMDAGLRLVYGKVPLRGPETEIVVPPDLLGLWTTITGPDKRFVGLAPVQYRQPMHAATARHAPGIALSADDDYLTCVFGARRELVPADDKLFAMTGVELRDLELAHVEGWDPVVGAIVAAQDAASIFPVSVRSSVPHGGWRPGPVALLGDAVHAMSPAIGVGANTALRDAQVLTARLVEAATAGKPVAEALDEYRREMLGYGFAAVRESAERGHRLVGQNPLPSRETLEA